MNSEADFVAAIQASPSDKLLLEAFADWLEEHGDFRAALVRKDSRLLREFMGPKFENPIPKMMEMLKSKRRVTDVRSVARHVGAPCVPAIVELLAHEDVYVRKQAVLCLRKIGRPAVEAVPALLEALKDESNDVREQAAKAITEIRPKKGTDVASLREALSDASSTVRRQAAVVLGSLGAKQEVLGQLVEQLDDADAGVRLDAANALGNLKIKPALAPLCRALADPSEAVRLAAASHLRNQVERGMSDAVEPLRAAVKRRTPEFRQAVVEALGKLGPVAVGAVPELLKLLEDRDPSVRIAVANALGQIAAGDDDALAALEVAAADPEDRVAAAVARAMGEWPRLPPRCAGTLWTLFARFPANSYWGRGEVIAAFGRLEPTPDVLELLRQVVRDRQFGYYRDGKCGPYVAIRRLGAAAGPLLPDVAAVARAGSEDAVRTLAHLGEAGIAELVEMTGDASEWVRVYAVQGLREAGEAAAAALPRLRQILRLNAGNDYRAARQKRSAVTTLRSLGPAAHEAIGDLLELAGEGTWGDDPEEVVTLTSFGEALVPHLDAIVKLLQKQDAFWIHARAARLLARIAEFTPDVLEPLRAALRNAAPPRFGNDYSRRAACEATRRHAVEGLSALREAAAPAVPELLPLLGDPVDDARREAAVALGKARSAAAVKALGSSLRIDANEAVRARAAEALGLIGDASAVADLVRSLKDQSPRVRRESAAALGRLKAKGETVIAALRAAEADEDRAVKAQATAALKKIAGQK